MVNHTMYSDEEDSQEDQYVNYKQKYRELKKNLRYLIYENECFQDELRKAQHNFVNISRDKSFLLDRILKYERPQGASSDSEATESSEEDDETRIPSSSSHFFPPKKKITKRKKSEAEVHNGNSSVTSETIYSHVSPKQLMMKSSHASKMISGKGNLIMKRPKKSPASRKPGGNKKEREITRNQVANNKNVINSQILHYDINNAAIENEEQVDMADQELPSSTPPVHFGFSTISSNEGHMTREEVERHLESRRFSPELNTTATVPAELFSHEPDPESDFEDGEICEFIQLEEDGISADTILE